MSEANDATDDIRQAPTKGDAGSVPAGGSGADSGATDAVGIDPDDTAPVQNISSQNDVPGVGTRGPDGDIESSTGGGVGSEGGRSAGAVEQETRSADPAFVRDDEHPDAAAHNARVSERDAGPDAQRARVDDDFQHLPRMAQNAPTRSEELGGLVAQTRADLGADAPRERVRDVMRQRLDDAGIAHDEGMLDELAEQVASA